MGLNLPELGSSALEAGILQRRTWEEKLVASLDASPSLLLPLMERQALFKEADAKEGVISPDILFSKDSSRVKSQFFTCLAVIFLTLAPNKLQFPLALGQWAS